MSAPKCCLICGRWGNRGFRPADQGREGSVCSNDRACAVRAHAWEYGFYDSNPDGDWAADPKPQTNPTIWWYVFGFPHKTAESAEHTGRKSTWGSPVIVRRRHDTPDDWEHVSEPPAVTTPDLETGVEG